MTTKLDDMYVYFFFIISVPFFQRTIEKAGAVKLHIDTVNKGHTPVVWNILGKLSLVSMTDRES